MVGRISSDLLDGVAREATSVKKLAMQKRPFDSRRTLFAALTGAMLLASTLAHAVTAVRIGSGYSIASAPLDPVRLQYTSTDTRTYVVAGCVPKNFPSPGVEGSTWLACNDLDYVKDKVIESPFISCLDIYGNGVLQGFFIKEVNNRTWKSFRFSCRQLQEDGTVGDRWQKAAFLFNYEKDGTLYESTAPTNRLSVGILEVFNELEVRQSLLQIAVEHATAADIHESGRAGKFARDIALGDKSPKASPAFIDIRYWNCPPGMVVTGAAIGHIPDAKGKHTRPVYLLLECRKLLHG